MTARKGSAWGKEALASVYEFPYRLLGAPGEGILALKKIYRDSPESDPSKELLSATGKVLSTVTEIPVLGPVVQGIGYLGDKGFDKAERLRAEAAEIRGGPSIDDRFYSWVGKSPVVQAVGGKMKGILDKTPDLFKGHGSGEKDSFYAHEAGYDSGNSPNSESVFDNIFGNGAFSRIKAGVKNYKN